MNKYEDFTTMLNDVEFQRRFADLLELLRHAAESDMFSDEQTKLVDALFRVIPRQTGVRDSWELTIDKLASK